MLPIPETTVWSSSWRLISECLRRNTVTTPSRLNSGSSGSRAICATGSGTSVPSMVTRSVSIQPPKVRWSTKFSVTPLSKVAAIRRCEGFGTSPSSICPLIPRCTTSASPLARVSHRYFPRRPVPVMVLPCRRAARSMEPATCLREARGCSTCTSVMVRSRMCAANPRRTTSTSGSSGIPGLVVGRGVDGTPRCGGGLEFGLFLGAPDPAAVLAFGNHHDRGEFLVVIGTLGTDGVRRWAEPACDGQLLQAALPIQPGAERRCGVEQFAEQPQDRFARNHIALVQIDCTQKGFDPVGEDAGLVGTPGAVLPLAEQQMVAEAEFASDIGEGLGVDDAGSQLGQITLGAVGVAVVELLGDGQAQHGVA